MSASKPNQIVTLILLVGAVFSILSLAMRTDAFHLPGNHEGYAPEQPIAYSHRLHAGELGIDCRYCHSGADNSRHAGIPAGNVCMNCHKFVTASFGATKEDPTFVAPELQKLYDTLGLDENRELDPTKEHRAVEWIKVHNLPDFVYFDHRSHVTAGVECQQCHGPVETMERMYQVSDLTMGWCVNCHRQVNEVGVGGKDVHASIDCSVCHY